MSLGVKQTKYGKIKTVNSTIDQWNHGSNDNDIEIYSTRNEGRSFAAERFIRTLKNKICKYMTYYQKMSILLN